MMYALTCFNAPRYNGTQLYKLITNMLDLLRK